MQKDVKDVHSTMIEKEEEKQIKRIRKLPSKMHNLISDYEESISDTNRLSDAEVKPILFGLFGEVGSLMSTSKKLHREKDAFEGFSRDVKEELGDTLWYVSALCERTGISIYDIFFEAFDSGRFVKTFAVIGGKSVSTSMVDSKANLDRFDAILLRLGKCSSRLLDVEMEPAKVRPLLVEFIQIYIEAVEISQVSFADVVEENITKTRGRFIEPSADSLPRFEDYIPEDEHLPRRFEIDIVRRPSGKYYLRWNDVYIGNALSDEIGDDDGYRFHDVFHLANAAVLHWSPAFRELIKCGRKSQQKIHNAQDVFRARVIDEGLSAYIFSYAKGLNFFEGHTEVSFNLLKTIRNFVKGYEVEECPLYLWESAILQGYEAWRKIRKNDGGTVIGNRDSRTLKYKLQD